MSASFVQAVTTRAADSAAQRAAASAPASLTTLPIDVQVLIFSKLSTPALFAAAQVDKKWQLATSHDDIYASCSFWHGTKAAENTYLLAGRRDTDLIGPISTLSVAQLFRLQHRHSICNAAGRPQFLWPVFIRPLGDCPWTQTQQPLEADSGKSANLECAWEPQAVEAVQGGLSLWSQPTAIDAPFLDTKRAPARLAGPDVALLWYRGPHEQHERIKRVDVVAARPFRSGTICCEYIAKVSRLPGLPPGTDGWLSMVDPVWTTRPDTIRVDIVNTREGRAASSLSVLDPEHSHPTIRLLFDATEYSNAARWVRFSTNDESNVELCLMSRASVPIPAAQVRVGTVAASAPPLRSIQGPDDPGPARSYEMRGPPPRLVFRAKRDIAPSEPLVCHAFNLVNLSPHAPAASAARRAEADLLQRRSARSGKGGYFVFAF